MAYLKPALAAHERHRGRLRLDERHEAAPPSVWGPGAPRGRGWRRAHPPSEADRCLRLGRAATIMRPRRVPGS